MQFPSLGYNCEKGLGRLPQMVVQEILNHLLPQTYQIYNYIWIISPWKRSEIQMNCVSTTKDKNYMEMARRGRDSLTKNPTSSAEIHYREGSHQSILLPKKQGVPKADTPTQGSALEWQVPKSLDQKISGADI